MELHFQNEAPKRFKNKFFCVENGSDKMSEE